MQNSTLNTNSIAITDFFVTPQVIIWIFDAYFWCRTHTLDLPITQKPIACFPFFLRLGAHPGQILINHVHEQLEPGLCDIYLRSSSTGFNCPALPFRIVMGLWRVILPNHPKKYYSLNAILWFGWYSQYFAFASLVEFWKA